MTTIKDVAKLAGVSVATVSRVMNQSGVVSDAKRKLVNEAILALNYSPFHDSTHSTHTSILVVVPNTINDFQSKLIDSLQSAASLYNMEMIIEICHNDNTVLNMCISRLMRRSVQAMILLGSSLTADQLNLLARDYPICICGDYVEGIHFLSVVSDVYQSTYNAVNHLIKKGFTRIGMISSIARAWSSLQKEAAYKQALMDNEIPYKQEYTFFNRFTKPGHMAFEYFESLPVPPNAIFAVSDFIASSVVNPILSKGYKLGVNYGLLGFDNTIYSSVTQVPITTVGQNLEALGKVAVTKLYEQIQNPENATRETIIIPSHLILRESTGDCSK